MSKSKLNKFKLYFELDMTDSQARKDVKRRTIKK